MSRRPQMYFAAENADGITCVAATSFSFYRRMIVHADGRVGWTSLADAAIPRGAQAFAARQIDRQEYWRHVTAAGEEESL